MPAVAESAPAEKVSRELWSKIARRQSHRRVLFGAAGACRHARAQMGTHRLHRLDRRPEGLSLCRAVCRRQARRRRPGARFGARNREGRHHRECRLPGLHRNVAARPGRRPHRRKTKRSEAEARRCSRRNNPQGRFIQPQEVADAVLWLCGDDSAAITGQAISVSGGETW